MGKFKFWTKEGKLIPLFIVSLLFLIPSINAIITCTPTSLSTVLTKGQTPLDQTLSCVNNANSSVTLTKLGSYFSLSSTSIGSLEQKDFIISFDSSGPAGLHYGSIQFSDSTSSIPITITIQEPQQSAGECSLDIFPTTLTNIKIPQGSIKNRQILITVPQCYPGKVNFRAVDLGSNVAPIELGELALGEISPGNSVNLPLVFDATQVQTGTYYESLSFNLANSSGIRIQVPSVSISATVTKGISPLTNDTFSTLPTCSITSINMQLNKTEQLICNNVHPDIQVVVTPNEYINGIRVDEASGQWIWTYMASIIGNTEIEYYFTYKGAQIGEINSQEIRITAGSQVIPGTSLKIKTFPEDLNSLKEGDTVSLLAQDNKTGNIIADFTLWLNGVKQESNSFTIETGKEYTISLSAPGYTSVEKTFTVSQKTVTISLSKNPIKINESIDITTDPSDALIYLNNAEINKTYFADAIGIFTFTASKTNYLNGTATLTVETEVTVTHSTPEEEIKIGSPISISLSKGANYFVYYQEDIEIPEFETIQEGNETDFTFTPEKKGSYWIEVEGQVIWDYEIKGWDWSIPTWLKWTLAIGGVILLLYFSLLRKRGEGKSYGAGYGVPSGKGEESILIPE